MIEGGSVQLTQLSTECGMTVLRAVPWYEDAKNREKARERLYMSVCLPLTHKGDRLKRLGGHENETKEC